MGDSARVCPAWWRTIQADFSAALQTPLHVVDGRLGTPPAVLAGALTHVLRARADDASPGPDVAARLRLYHEQVWTRRLVTCQRGLPTLCERLGPWRFNLLVLEHFREQHPSSDDLGDVLATVCAWLDGIASPLRREPLSGDPTLLEAFRYDEAMRRAFATKYTAPVTDTYRGGRLVACPGFALARRPGPAGTGTSTQHVVYRAPLRVVSREIHLAHARWLVLTAARGTPADPADIVPLSDPLRASDLGQRWLTEALRLGFFREEAGAGGEGGGG
jgi:hypothetical protein